MLALVALCVRIRYAIHRLGSVVHKNAFLLFPVLRSHYHKMVVTVTGIGTNDNEDVAKVEHALHLIRRQMHLIGDSLQSVLWQWKEVQHLKNLGEVDIPITSPELIKKLELLEMETYSIMEAMATAVVRLSLIISSDN